MRPPHVIASRVARRQSLPRLPRWSPRRRRPWTGSGEPGRGRAGWCRGPAGVTVADRDDRPHAAEGRRGGPRLHAARRGPGAVRGRVAVPPAAAAAAEVGSYCGNRPCTSASPASWIACAGRTSRLGVARPDLVDPGVGKWTRAGSAHPRRRVLEASVVAVVGESPAVARAWATPLAFLFIDGWPRRRAGPPRPRPVDTARRRGHPRDPRRVPRPADGGRPPVRADLPAGDRVGPVP